MSDRIKQRENPSEEQKSIQAEEKTSSEQFPEYPENYINPFDYPANDEMHVAPDGYPYVFSDVDFELKRSPRLFKGLDTYKYDPEEIENSKSAAGRYWQYSRWKMWRYLYEQKTGQMVMQKTEKEEEFARGTVSLNGVVFYILKGVDVDVPLLIKEIVLTSQKQTSIAGRADLVTSIAKKLDPVTGLPKDPTRLDR